MSGMTDYTPDVIDKTRDYINHTRTNGFPSIAGLAVYLGRARSTIYKWAKESDKKEFSDILEELLAVQESDLLYKGLNGDYNPTITKLILTKHGYSDKTETDVTSGGKPLPTPILGNVLKNDSNPEDNQTA